MPNLSYITRKISSPVSCRCCPRMIDQIPNEYVLAHISEEEKIAAKESLEAYCTPVDLYRVLQSRAIKKPLFLQRNLSYKIEAKHQRRIQMTFSFPGSKDAASEETQKLFPFYIMLARLVPNEPNEEYSTAVYKYSRLCRITGFDGDSQGKANFLLPRMDKLALDAKPGALAILIISFADFPASQFDVVSSTNQPDDFILEGPCLCSKIPLESLYSSWQKYPNMEFGQKVNSGYLVKMQPFFLQLTSTIDKKCVEIHQGHSNPLTSSSPQQMKVTISAEEVGPKEKSPYSYTYSLNDNPSSSVLKIIRLREGNVVFKYRYYNNMLEKTQVTEDFACSICSVKCGSFKGLQCHMPSTHDLFNFEFWVNEEYQVVNVSLKSETYITEITEDDITARREPYFFSSMKSKRRKHKKPVRISSQGPHRTNDAGGAGSSSQTVRPVMSLEESQVKLMWTSFARKHRVFEDGRVSWGCDEFSKLHGPFMVRGHHLWYWRQYIWSRWAFGHLDCQTLMKCVALFDQLEKLKTQKPFN